MTDKKFEIILFEKLNRFINKYYKTRILKGFILLIAALLSFLILFALIENFTRMSSFSRKFIFFGYIFINLFILIKFVLIPFFQLLRIGKGLNYIDAAKIIGNHFPEINDKVINLLQLNNLSEKDSGLIYASIRQKTKSIEPFSFRSVITFKENRKYLKWIALPLLISFSLDILCLQFVLWMSIRLCISLNLFLLCLLLYTLGKLFQILYSLF